GSELQGREQLLLGVGSYFPLLDLLPRFSSRDKLNDLDGKRQYRAHRRRVVTDRTPIFWIPKFRIINRSCPSPLYGAHEAIFPFDGGFVAMLSENQNRCVA